MKIASYPPSRPRPSAHDAARHIAEEARLVLASLRGGPPYVARGELALGLRELRSFVRGRLLDTHHVSGSAGAGERGGAEHYPASHSNLGASVAASTPREGEDGEAEVGPAPQPPQIRVPPPPSPSRGDAGNMSDQLPAKGGLPPPPMPAINDEEKSKAEEGPTVGEGMEAGTTGAEESQNEEPAPEQRPLTPPEAPASPTPPTPHSVPPPPVSPDHSKSSGVPSPPFLPIPPNPALAVPDMSNNLQQSQHKQIQLDPGPYAAPFLAVIVDPRAAGPHTLVALRSLHRLLERGSIVQLTRCGASNGESKQSSSINNASSYVHETALEPIARGVLACRFEQTDAGADEAVEMAIADLLKLLVELDAAGARAAEAALLKQVYISKRAKGQSQKQQKGDAKTDQQATSATARNSSENTPKSGTMMRIARLPSTVLMESFHAVFVTRQTFVRDGGGHHSPALSFHFEQVLTRLVSCIFGGEDAQSSLKGKAGMISSGHVVAAGKIMVFLIDGVRAHRDQTSGKWSSLDGAAGDDERTLCLRLIQCCLQTGWGNGTASPAGEAGNGNAKSNTTIQPATTCADDQALSHLVEDDLCLALLNAGQAIWAHHDEIPSGSNAASSSSGGDAFGVPSGTSLELLSEVCATLSLLWSLPRLRTRLRSQFEAIFSGFYQRALSLLRRRPLPEDGAVYQANMIFDAEVEVILESLVDVLCLNDNSGNTGQPLSTLEELFLTYDCSMTESDVAAGLLVELSRCCGGVVDEEGEPYLPSMPPSRAGTSGSTTPKSNDAGAKPMLIAKHRSVPDHLKELCFEALLGSLRRLFHGVESLPHPLPVESGDPKEKAKPNSPLLRSAKSKKRSLHHAARLFNQKPRKGLQYLLEGELLPSPPDAKSVASFLRNGLVVGLDKAAVGQYLGEIGKADKASTPVWEQDWFHQELLTAFCSSFEFGGLTVLDSLRMFLATFRLPGEAQMIDRILQAFAESVARQCEESATGSLKVFSTDEKRASDAAYLLSFSIIMLNTDLHNDNIRADRKMKLSDFVRNNKNYGKEISDKDLPFEYLEGIYSAIKAEQIRTLGEGADGSMTSERWKDVMRSASSFQSHGQIIKSGGDAKDLKELLLESSWQPILSAVSGLWGMVPYEVYQADAGALDQNGSLMGARMGIDLAHDMLSGASSISRPDIFQDLLTNICHMSGLLSEHNKATEERVENFLNSMEHQSAFTVAINIAEENGDMVGIDGWKCVWGLLFELRDGGLLSGRNRPSIMRESDPDLLSPEARDEFCAMMANWDDMDDGEGQSRKGMTLMSFVFGSSESLEGGKNTPSKRLVRSSPNGKDEYLIWDELASSDDEGEPNTGDNDYLAFPPGRSPRASLGLGATFENLLVYENTMDNEEIGVTGLERIDVSHSHPMSLRARVRHRLSQMIDFYGLIAESRYLSEEGLSDTLNALVEIIRDSSKRVSDDNGDALVGLPLSPASEALAEILLCEIALKNRDRFTLVWDHILRAHYNSRLTYRHSRGGGEHGVEEHNSETIKLTPGIEKCVTGILRLCVWSSNRNVMSSQVLSTLKILHPPLGALVWSPLELNLDKHLAEGLWRMCRNVDGLTQIDAEGWSGILGLAEWCATRGGLRYEDNLGSLAEDDPSLQAFRSLHLILHAAELKDSLQVDRWPQIVRSVRCLVEAGERGHCPKLSIAGLDLLQVLHTRMETLAAQDDEPQHLFKSWVPILEAISEPAEKSRNGSVRQQAISLLTDTLLDRHGGSIPVDSGLCEIMNTITIPLAGKRITDLLRIPYDVQNDLEENLIELELCISLLFKPFLHHLKALVAVKQEFVGIWISMLGIMTQLLGEESNQTAEDNAAVREGAVTREKLFLATKELGSEHLRNAVMVLSAMGVLIGDVDSPSDAQEFSSVTWSAIGSIGYCKPYLEEWKSSAC